MKGSPNNSTSPAKKSENAGILRYSSATDLKIGILQVYTYVRSNFEPIWKFSIFCGPSSSLFFARPTLEPQEFSESCRNFDLWWYSSTKTIFSNPLKISVAIDVCIRYSKIKYEVRSTRISQNPRIFWFFGWRSTIIWGSLHVSNPQTELGNSDFFDFP